MVGYKNPMYEKFGYFSAKLDDWLNFIPSRLTAFIMVISNVMHSEFTAKHVFSIIKRDAPKHPSPNSGYGESAVAALLGIQLEVATHTKELFQIVRKWEILFIL